MSVTFLTTEDKQVIDQSISRLSEEISKYNTITPQMFGAVADGVADDTVAVQTALDTGNIIYFPPGRYKVTSQLTCTRSCKITMCKPYPIGWEGGKGDHPLTSDENWMGSRIETYTSDDYGLLIGDGVQIDGLYMRAMKGFSGVLFKYDGHLGCKTYPSQVKLSHMQLDCAFYDVNPVSMFDFVPDASYFAILDDIVIGSLRGRQICDYGFRSILDGVGGWGNSMRINNLCIDILADYPLYLDGNGDGMENWVFENLSIQAYPYLADQGYMYRTGHVNVITLKNMQSPVFMGCHIWDLHAASVLNEIIHVENCTGDISCLGCSKEFDDVETELKAKLKNVADSLSIKNLTMSVSSVEETGANKLVLSDGINETSVDIPAATASDEQVSNGVSKWFDENARPKEQVGRNKFNPLDIDTVNGYVSNGIVNYDASLTCSHFIEAVYGSEFRMSRAGKDVAAYRIYCFDADKNPIGMMSGFSHSGSQMIDIANTSYIRVVYTSSIAAYADRATAQIMMTINDPVPTIPNDRMYEPYKVTYVGGLGDIVMLTSPDGTQYRLSVTNDGTVIATAIGGDEEPDEDIITDIVWNISDRTPVDAGFATADKARTIDYGTYIIGVSSAGLWNGNTGTSATLDGEDFTVTTTQGGMGIGVPFELSHMSTYTISLDIDAKARASISYYDEYGVFRDSEVIIADNNVAGSYAHRFIVKPYKYLVFHFAGSEMGVPTKFSNIKIEYMPN